MAKIDPRIAAAQKAALELEKNYGLKAGSSGHNIYDQGVVSTGSLTWDYLMGTGGHKMGTFHEIFGGFSIGKTTIAGFSALRNAQAQGMLTGVIAVEPDIEEDWMVENGINLDYNVIGRPDSGEEAFGMLSDWIFGGTVDFILFDSIGAISSQKELDSDKSQAFGNSAMISWGVKRVAARAWKNNVGVVFINQQRDDTKSRIAGLVDSPGGHAFKHMMKMRTHLKPGKDRYTVKMNDGVENKDVMVGRQIVASFKKNKAAPALGKSARFDFYHIPSELHPLGFDVAKDIITAGTVSGVFERNGGWIVHPILPGGKLNGKAKLDEWIKENPERLPDIRAEVIQKMKKDTVTLAKSKTPTLKAVDAD